MGPNTFDLFRHLPVGYVDLFWLIAFKIRMNGKKGAFLAHKAVKAIDTGYAF